ncbi:hypothetical protein MMPV_000443 [Pyropia vietnamensis]
MTAGQPSPPRRSTAASAAAAAATLTLLTAAFVAVAPAATSALRLVGAPARAELGPPAASLLFASSAATVALGDGSRVRYARGRPVVNPPLADLRARAPIAEVSGFSPGGIFGEWDRLAVAPLVGVPTASTPAVTASRVSFVWHGLPSPSTSVVYNTTDEFSFGVGVAAVGDLDGDGVEELAVSSGAQWPLLNVLFLDAASGLPRRVVTTNLTADLCAPVTERVVVRDAPGRAPPVNVGFELRNFSACGAGRNTFASGGEAGPRFVRLGDVDGDGIPDVMSYQPNSPVLFVHFLTAAGVPSRTIPVNLQPYYGRESNFAVFGPDYDQVWPLPGITGVTDGSSGGAAVAVRALASPLPTPLPPSCFGPDRIPICDGPPPTESVVLLLRLDASAKVVSIVQVGLDGRGGLDVPSLSVNGGTDLAGFGSVGFGFGPLSGGRAGLLLSDGDFGVAPAVSRLYLLEVAPDGTLAAGAATPVDDLFPPLDLGVVQSPYERRVEALLPATVGDGGGGGAGGVPVLIKTVSPNVYADCRIDCHPDCFSLLETDVGSYSTPDGDNDGGSRHRSHDLAVYSEPTRPISMHNRFVKANGERCTKDWSACGAVTNASGKCAWKDCDVFKCMALCEALKPMPKSMMNRKPGKVCMSAWWPVPSRVDNSSDHQSWSWTWKDVKLYYCDAGEPKWGTC